MPDYEYGEDGLPKRKKRVRQRQSSDSEGSTFHEDPNAGSRTRKIYTVDQPDGGQVHLQTPSEVSYYEKLRDQYQGEYEVEAPNDLARLSQLLTLELTIYRKQQRMLGAVVYYDDQGNMAGWEEVSSAEQAQIADSLPKLQAEVRNLEKALKLDRSTREGTGEGEIRRYMETLKGAANDYKIHLSERYTKFDEFVSELRWRLRVLRLPEEMEDDKKYHNISQETVIEFCEQQLRELEELDKEFAKNKQSLWVGQI